MSHNFIPIGYLGQVHAVTKDKIGNLLPTVIPFSLMERCILNLFHSLKSISPEIRMENHFTVHEIPVIGALIEIFK